MLKLIPTGWSTVPVSMSLFMRYKRELLRQEVQTATKPIPARQKLAKNVDHGLWL